MPRQTERVVTYSRAGQTYIGVDFGTTNTVVSLADASGAVRTLVYPSAQGPLPTFRSVLCYVHEDNDALGGVKRVFCGADAIEAFLRQGDEARLIQSVKTFLSSKSFSRSTIHGRDYSLEDIVADFLRGLLKAAQWPDGVADLTGTIAVGRPVRFAGDGDDALAEARLRAAFLAAGIANIEFGLEPQAAAIFFAKRLCEPATVLVADFGGGTSDFSIVQFDPETGKTEALAHTGVGIAGDTLDYRIIDKVVAPAFGKGSRFRPQGRWLEVPKWIYFEFEHWHRLSFLKRPAVLRELREIELTSDAPQALAWLREFLEQELGFHLYQAVNRCKTALSSADHAELVFEFAPISLRCTISRADFEQWIAPDVAAIEAACSDALAQAGLSADDMSVVFMTGGTSFVPLLRQRFESRFGAEKIVAGDEFVSVGSGLALLAREREFKKYNKNK